MLRYNVFHLTFQCFPAAPAEVIPGARLLQQVLNVEPGFEYILKVIPTDSWRTLVFQRQSELLEARAGASQDVQSEFNFLSVDGLLIDKFGVMFKLQYK